MFRGGDAQRAMRIDELSGERLPRRDRLGSAGNRRKVILKGFVSLRLVTRQGKRRDEVEMRPRIGIRVPGRSRPSGQLDRAGSKFEGRGDAIGDGPERVENGPREGRPRSLGQRSFFRHPRLAQAVVIPVKNFEIARKGPGQAPPAIWNSRGRNNLSLMRS